MSRARDEERARDHREKDRREVHPREFVAGPRGLVAGTADEPGRERKEDGPCGDRREVARRHRAAQNSTPNFSDVHRVRDHRARDAPGARF